MFKNIQLYSINNLKENHKIFFSRCRQMYLLIFGGSFCIMHFYFSQFKISDYIIHKYDITLM